MLRQQCASKQRNGAPSGASEQGRREQARSRCATCYRVTCNGMISGRGSGVGAAGAGALTCGSIVELEVLTPRLSFLGRGGEPRMVAISFSQHSSLTLPGLTRCDEDQPRGSRTVLVIGVRQLRDDDVGMMPPACTERPDGV